MQQLHGCWPLQGVLTRQVEQQDGVPKWRVLACLGSAPAAQGMLA
jgi:hypothetical protein